MAAGVLVLGAVVLLGALTVGAIVGMVIVLIRNR